MAVMKKIIALVVDIGAHPKLDYPEQKIVASMSTLLARDRNFLLKNFRQSLSHSTSDLCRERSFVLCCARISIGELVPKSSFHVRKHSPSATVGQSV